MKKIIFLTTVFLLAGITTLWAIKPIPSYNVPIFRQQTFVEKRTSQDPSPKGKRDMNVKSTVTSTNKPTPTLVVVYIFSMDGRDVMGPYTLVNNQTLTVTVDEREWGVYAVSDDHVELSVWYTPYSPPLTEKGNYNLQFNQNPLIPAVTLRQFYSV